MILLCALNSPSLQELIRTIYMCITCLHVLTSTYNTQTHTHPHNTQHTHIQSVDMGAIVDPTQRKSIDEYVQQAKQDGAEVYQACACMPSRGCFYPPTLITKVEPVSICVQEEVG